MRSKKNLLIIFILAIIASSKTVYADGNDAAIHLSTYGIKEPDEPTDIDATWSGSYVYFGKYKGESVRYRVLDPKTTEYGGETLFLDFPSVRFQTTALLPFTT